MKWHRGVHVHLLVATGLPVLVTIILFYHGLHGWPSVLWGGVMVWSCWVIARLSQALSCITEVVAALSQGDMQRRVCMVKAGVLAPLANGINQVAQGLAHGEAGWQERLQQETQALQLEKEAAERCARLDPLTGLWNRRALWQLTQLEIDKWQTDEGRSLTLLAMDLDHFKAINDGHGHAGGDAVLAQFAQLLCQELRVVDIAARVGGEEFVVILPDTNLEAAVAVAERIRCAAWHTPARLAALAVPYTVSVGVAPVCPGVAGLENAMAQADLALYRAKREGRNRVVLATSLG